MKVHIELTIEYPARKTGVHSIEFYTPCAVDLPDDTLRFARRLELTIPRADYGTYWSHVRRISISLEKLTMSPRGNFLHLEDTLKFENYSAGLEVHRGLLSEKRFRTSHCVWAPPFKSESLTEKLSNFS